MNDQAVSLMLCGCAGALLGAFFFGGLWYTVDRGLRSGMGAAWFLGSLVIRTAGVLGGFYLFTGFAGERLMACLGGFVAVQLLVGVVNRRTGPGKEASNHEDKP